MEEVKQPELDLSKLVDLCVVFAMGIDIVRPRPKKQKRRDGVDPNIVNTALDAMRTGQPPHNLPYGDDPTLMFLWQLSAKQPRARQLIEDVMGRWLYQRVLEIPLSDASLPDWQRLVGMFKDRRGRLGLEDAINKALCDQLRAAIGSSQGTGLSLDISEARLTLERLIEETVPFVVDLPTRGWQPAEKAPPVVIDAKRKYYMSRRSTGGVLEQPLWEEHLYPMMKDAAVFRILAHPSVHSMLGSFLGADDLLGTLRKQVKVLRPLID